MVEKIKNVSDGGGMKELILVYEKNPRVLQFLRSFFKSKKTLNAEFMEDIVSLREKALHSGDSNILCLVAVDELARLRPSHLGHPVIAIIAQAPKAGIKKAIKHGIENYVIDPIQEEDLGFKIRTALERRRTIHHLRKEADNLQTIVELTYLISSTLDPQEILYLIVKKISEIVPVTRCSIIHVDPGHNYAYVIATYEDPNVRSIKLDLKKYPEIQEALTSKRVVYIGDVNKNPLMKKVRDIIYPLGIRSVIVIPIVFHDKVIGTLFLRTSRTGYAFSEHEIKLCNAIANASANSLYNACLFEKIENEKSKFEKLAITDYMTGIYNIRYFYHRLGEEFSRSQRYRLDLSCLMLDIDLFKEINDKYGHKAGDSVLREFSRLLKRHVRESDVLARYGGEEFIALLPQTSESGALAKAEAMRRYIEKYRFRGLKGSRGLTVSIGVASYPTHKMKNKEDLITFADNALYTAKASGRNRVAVYNP